MIKTKDKIIKLINLESKLIKIQKITLATITMLYILINILVFSNVFFNLEINSINEKLSILSDNYFHALIFILLSSSSFLILSFLKFYIIKTFFKKLNLPKKYYKFIENKKLFKIEDNPKLSIKSIKKAKLLSSKNLNLKTDFYIKNVYSFEKNKKRGRFYYLKSFQNKKETFSGSFFELNHGYSVYPNLLEFEITEGMKEDKSYLGDLEFNLGNEKVEKAIEYFIDNYPIKINQKIKLIFTKEYFFLIVKNENIYDLDSLLKNKEYEKIDYANDVLNAFTEKMLKAI